jgi:hypothetical protein
MLRARRIKAPDCYPTIEEVVMQDRKKNPVRIDLTEEQKQRIREQTGKDAAAIEFTVEELEERIAPIAPLNVNAM